MALIGMDEAPKGAFGAVQQPCCKGHLTATGPHFGALPAVRRWLATTYGQPPVGHRGGAMSPAFFLRGGRRALSVGGGEGTPDAC